ncbi:MAG: AraC family transcriptional regulator [Sinimarinibacterium flocculans]|uniref:AraC family transcriptional regulator n=1 Tax=Sinimarinibacterium flocculans TaxID=985250 RepID=UPI002491D842|nr:AraC family transcriptional regulator [Sinimarinibacterium flocculans]MEC9361814.1 AraC family transcriptional regulator [Pseudomonadota bacterium]
MRDSGQFLLVVHEAMVKAGIDVDAIYRKLGYDAAKLPLKELRTPHQQQALFWQIVEGVTGDADIGLHLCPHLPLFRGEVIEYLMFSSPTFGEGIVRALKYLRLISDALSVRLVHDADGARIGVIGSALEAPQLRHTEICVVYELIQFARSVTERHFDPPLKVKLRCSARSPQADYEQVFGCPVEFDGSESEIWFDPALLEYRSPRWDPDLLRLHEELAQKRLSDLHRRDLVEQIRKVLSQRLELESCDLDDVAREVGLAPRRLRFELARAGTSFSQIVTDFRYALARRLLARTEESIDNIVYLTGFSEPSTFYRAFKRWSGLTPVQFRERHRAG